ncbi:Redoxin domain-containing protein (fragment) [Mesorhizobium sp. ORS 3324]
MFLQMGSPLPPINLKTWLRGDPIAHFQSSKMYFVGCSATRHPMQLQESLKDSCLEVIGAAVRERSLTMVEAPAKLDAVDPELVQPEFPDRVRWPYSLYRSPDRTR